MSTFSALQTKIAARLHEPSDSTVIAEELVDALHYYRSERAPWSTKSYSLTTVSGLTQYERGVHLPDDLHMVDYVAIDYGGNSRHEVPRVPYEELRDRDYYASVTQGTPIAWAWEQQSMWVYPPSSGGNTLQIDYLQDSTRDELTGNEITSSASTETNEWIKQAAQLLTSRVMVTYSMLRGWDDSRAAAAQALNKDLEERLRREMSNQRAWRMQVVGFWGD